MSEPLVLHDYQQRVRDRMVSQPFLGLFLDPGLGKTAITLSAYMALRDRFEAMQMLVVAPLRVAYGVWPQEAQKWAPFQGLRVHLLHGDGLNTDALRSKDIDIHVINPEGLKFLCEHARHIRLPDMLAVDESTKFKHPTSDRSKRLRSIQRLFDRRYILTGTPAPNGLIDLHGQMHILDFGSTLGTRKKDYLSDHFIPTETISGIKWFPKRGATQEIYRKLSPWVVRLDARDHLELPELINTTIEVDLPERARRIYDELRAEMVIQLEEGDVVAANPGVLTGKCRQIANGSVYYTEDGDYAVRPTRRAAKIHDAKAGALADLVEELSGQPLLVAYEHEHELRTIRETLKPLVGEVPYIGGGVSGKQGARIEQSWNAGRLPVLCLHPKSAAHGLNLQTGGAKLAWYCIPWDLEEYDQLVRRVWRQGQTETTFVYHIVARGTVDQLVMRALAQKSRTQAELLNLLREDLLR